MNLVLKNFFSSAAVIVVVLAVRVCKRCVTSARKSVYKYGANDLVCMFIFAHIRREWRWVEANTVETEALTDDSYTDVCVYLYMHTHTRASTYIRDSRVQTYIDAHV